MKRILQIAATSIALLLVFAVAIPAFAASICPTANTSPISDCLAKYKLTASDIGSIQEALKACGLGADALRYGPVCETGDCTTPDCTKVNCDGTECVTTDCPEIVCGNTGSTSDEQLNSCTEADCANNGCDAADCQDTGCKDTCADTRCIPTAEEEPANEPDDTAAEVVVPAETQDDADVKAVETETTGNATIDEAIIKANEAVKNYTSSSNCPQTDDGSDEEAGIVIAPQQGSERSTSGSGDVRSQLQDAVNKALEQANSQASSNSNCPTGGGNSAQIQDAINQALDQARAQVSSGSNCPTGSGSTDVSGILNQLRNSGLQLQQIGG